MAESLYPILLLLVVIFFPFSGIKHAAVVLVLVDLIQRSIAPVKDISGKIANIQRAFTGFDRLDSFLEDFKQAPRVLLSQNLVKAEVAEMVVSIQDFTYEGKNERESFTLTNLEFNVHLGELVGVLGLSGSGKTTLLNILAGNLIAQKFSIILRDTNGKEILCFSDKSLELIDDYRSQIGLVAQDSHVFSESLALNISMGLGDEKGLGDFWLWIKKQIPYLERWNIQLEDKVQPAKLSLGQIQLLSAIRACYLKKPIVLFDEISSSLDSDLEAALRSAIKIVQERSMTFIVAHRLETLINADSLLLLDKGRLIARDHHQNLINESTLYQTFIAELRH